MGIKTVTKVIEVKICDACGAELNELTQRIDECSICHQEMCPYCAANIRFNKLHEDGTVSSFNLLVCRTHLPEFIFEFKD